MAFKKLSIILVPEGANRVKQFRLSNFLLVFFVVLFISPATYLSWILKDYWAVKAKIPQMAYLEKENEHQKRQFIHLAQRIDVIARQMGELKSFDNKLRVMVNLDTEDDDGQQQGLGGSDPSLLIPDYSMAQTHKGLIQLMNRSLDNLSNEISVGKQDKAELHKFLENQQMLLASTPSIWPTRGWLSSRFGYRTSPFTGEREFHRGIDISTRMNTPIVAPANGLVTFSGTDHGYGRMLAIKHGRGLVTRYAHLQKALVKKGEYVKRGDTIALVGNTGRSTGPHLHYEVHLNGLAVNPLRYILN